MPGLMQREYDLTPVASKTIGDVFGKKAKVNSFMKNVWKLIKGNDLKFTQK